MHIVVLQWGYNGHIMDSSWTYDQKQIGNELVVVLDDLCTYVIFGPILFGAKIGYSNIDGAP